MRVNEVELYRAPGTNERLKLEGEKLISQAGDAFAIENGVPNLLWPPELAASERKTKQEYDRVANHIYDAALEWQFAALYQDEDEVREHMVDMLPFGPGARILEVGCGTGRDSIRLAKRLRADGSLFMQDLSPAMVHATVQAMEGSKKDGKIDCELHYSISNAIHLPFEDGAFDAVFHFGGFNEFSDGKAACEEFARVVRPGGTVLFGDESVGPWLRNDEFGKIVIANNRLFAHQLPLEAIPVCARKVNVRWIMANCFYVITFEKGDGPPPLDLDLMHKGWRGGSMRSRYFGVLEGVSPEAKELAKRAAASAGVSVHEWLDRLVRNQAASDLDEKTSGP